MGSLGAFSNPYASSVKQAKKGRKGFQQAMGTVDPFYTQNVNTGMNASGSLSDMFGFTGNRADTVANFRTAPGYQFMMDQGTKAIDQSAAARGMSQSGSALKSLLGYGQGMADQSWQQDINNKMNLMQTGFQGAGGLTNNAKTLADLRMVQGNAQDMNAQGGMNNMLGAIGTGIGLLGGYGGGGLGGGLMSMFGGGGAPTQLGGGGSVPNYYGTNQYNPFSIY